MTHKQKPDSTRRAVPTVLRWLLGAFFIVAGIAHFAVPASFRAQVPAWMPLPSTVIAVSGAVEIAVGAGLIAARDAQRRRLMGWVAAGLLIVVWVGNISQAVSAIDGFGLRTDTARWIRVAAQPVLVMWALWSTDAWRSRPTLMRAQTSSRSRPD
ncbi:MAG: MauE/DoxX family redox-associated membrane protein [Nitriliruptoraceae bacterium]